MLALSGGHQASVTQLPTWTQTGQDTGPTEGHLAHRQPGHWRERIFQQRAHSGLLPGQQASGLPSNPDTELPLSDLFYI